jgi:SAM-dependent methyltransferase
MRPAKLPFTETLHFVERALPSRPARILDVGCGRGELATELHSRGFAVTAIDSEVESVLLTQARGVPSKQVTFPAYDEEALPLDVVIFARSLHHIGDLAGAVERAFVLLRPGGTLILEEFDLDAIDAATALWHYDALGLLEATGVLPPDPDDDALRGLPPLERWRAEHAVHGELHGGEAMTSAVAGRFRVVERQAAPYLYRTACARLEESARGQRAAERLLAQERRGIELGLLRPVGLRIVAKRG